jgi:SpoIID/LytB domain protein
MRYNILLKALLCTIFLLLAAICRAGEYRDSTLWVEVNIASGKEITIRGQDPGGQIYNLEQEDSPVSRELKGNLKIQSAGFTEMSYWGFLDRVEKWSPEIIGMEDVVMRSYPVWDNGLLHYRRERLIFVTDSFETYDQAISYAIAKQIPTKSIMEIPATNFTVKITLYNGQTMFMETPLRISTEDSISPDGGGYHYSGDFILKTVKDRLVLNHFLPLDEYIAGVIPNEIGSNAPPEALKAQAVAARTHAISLLLYNRHKNEGYDLCNGTHCQVYKGQYLSGADVRNAVFETSGEIIIFNGKVIDATYHSCCGGKTDASSNIWKGNPVPYLMGITCDGLSDSLDLSEESDAREWLVRKVDCQGSSSWERSASSWHREVPLATLSANTGAGNISAIKIQKRGSSGRIVLMTIQGDKTVVLDSEARIRKAFGGIPSSFFFIDGRYSSGESGIRIEPNRILKLTGKGSGHGVGMCQVGALRMSRNNADYKEILNKYYPGTSVTADWMAYE